MIRIAVDGNGGDFGLETTVLGSMMAVKKFPNLEITIFGDEEKIKELLTDSTRITVVHTKDTISMGEKDPVRAIRHQKDASLCLAMKACKNGEADACVTSGPTQCVVVGAHLLVRRLPQMERVALCPFVPNMDGHPRLLLDVGANVELRKEHLGSLAIFASVVSKEVLGVKNPKVGLLNNGTEEHKGTPTVQEAYALLKENKHINFVGNIESREIPNSPCDVLITDGFTGNITLKLAEGMGNFMFSVLKKAFTANTKSKISYLLIKNQLKDLKKNFSSSSYGGAPLLGISKPVIKAHGSCKAENIYCAILQAISYSKSNIIERVQESLK
jgi:glycerol-3-phosphate acyltransferase PlsX